MLTDDELIAGLFRYIRLNKSLPAFFAEIEKHPEDHHLHCDALKQAVMAGDPDAAIFSHPNVSYYLLYLIKNKMVPYWQGMTAYFYCMLLMQGKGKHKQSLSESDTCTYKLNNCMGVAIAMNEVGSLTEAGKVYLASVERQFLQYPWISFKADDVMKVWREGSPIDRWLFEIDIHFTRALFGYSQFLEILSKDVFYWQNNNNGFTRFPSFAVVNAIHADMCEKPISLMPVFGRISKKTLIELHKEDIHPLVLYSPKVKSNTLIVHEFDCGPVPAFLHDIAHAFWANTFSYDNRKLITGEFRELFKSYYLQAEMKESRVKDLDKLLFEMIDYNMSPFQFYRFDGEDRLFRYVVSAFGRKLNEPGVFGIYANEKTFKDTDRCDQPQDDLLYLSGRMRTHSDFWNRVYEANLSSANGKRNPKVIAEIVAAVNTANKNKKAMRSISLFKPAEITQTSGDQRVAFNL